MCILCYKDGEELQQAFKPDSRGKLQVSVYAEGDQNEDYDKYSDEKDDD